MRRDIFARLMDDACQDCEAYKFEEQFLAMQSDAESLLVEMESYLKRVEAAGWSALSCEAAQLLDDCEEFSMKHITGEKPKEVRPASQTPVPATIGEPVL